MSKHARSRATLPVDGVESETSEGWTFPAHNPASGEVLWQVPDASVADAHAAAQAAWRAFHETQWSTDTALRADVVGQLQTALTARSDDLALLLAAETGVPVSQRSAHVDAPISAMRPERRSGTPGVTVVLTPATSPVAVAVREIGRVLVDGGTVVLKPAPEAASAAIEIGRIGLDILPRGVLNVVTTRDVDVAMALALDQRVDAISFSGSPVAAERIRLSGERARKQVRLDVGGSTTIEAADDADLASVVSSAAVTVAVNAGQGCRLPATVIVPPHRYAEALAVAVATMEEVVVGDPAEPGTLCGPLRSRVARERVERYLSLARSEGGSIETGGHALDRGGWWIAPTVIGGLGRRSRLVREEVLGPVLMVVADA